MKPKTRMDYRIRRHSRIRRKIAGTAERPRMAVMVSNRHMQVQFIDDEEGKTLFALSTQARDVPQNMEGAKALGTEAGTAAVKAGMAQVVVDRGGLRYHGRVKAIVEAALECGLRISKQDKKSPVAEAAAAEADAKEDQ